MLLNKALNVYRLKKSHFMKKPNSYLMLEMPDTSDITILIRK